MTSLVAVFPYHGGVGEREMRALDGIRDVYGIWALRVDEKGQKIRVEYDASRLKQSDIGFMLRNAGIRLSDFGIKAA